MLETSARLLRLLSLLQSGRDWTGAELADRLEVSARTVRADVERLRRLGEPPCTVPPEDPPFYERYGASQVAGGQYADVLRYREHFAPLAAAVWRSAVEEEPWAASAS